MPIPESSTTTLRPDLTVMAQEFAAAAAMSQFIGVRAAPVFLSPQAEGAFPVFRAANFRKPTNGGDISRQEDGTYLRIRGEFGKGAFVSEDRGLEYPIDKRMLRRYATWFNCEQVATQQLMYQVALAREIRVAALYSGASLTSNSPDTVWSTSASAIPLDDIQTGLNTLQDNCGVPASGVSVIMPRADFREFLSTDQVNDKVKYTYPGIQPANLSAELVAQMLGVKQVLIGTSSYDSKEQGIDASMSQVWTAGKVYLAVLADSASNGSPGVLEEPSFARTAWWMDGAAEMPLIEVYEKEENRSRIVRLREDTDEFVQTESPDSMCYELTT